MSNPKPCQRCRSEQDVFLLTMLYTRHGVIEVEDFITICPRCLAAQFMLDSPGVYRRIPSDGKPHPELFERGFRLPEAYDDYSRTRRLSASLAAMRLAGAAL